MNTELLFQEEHFVEYLLNCYYRNDTKYFDVLINYSVIKKAIKLFEMYFQDIDDVKKSDHIKIIRKMFSEDINGKNCGSELQISFKTYYRYKKKYIKVFQSYLLRTIIIKKDTAFNDTIFDRNDIVKTN